jgi:hypothetical protein
MKQRILLAAVFLSGLAAEDRFTLGGANGITFSEFRGYETWQSIAPSAPSGALKVTTGNAAMINAYKEGFPGNGKPVPDGAMIAKMEWTSTKDPESPYQVAVPGTLKRVGFMIKDSKRFPESDGWGYAQWLYDAPSKTFKPEYSEAAFGKKVCHQCHTLVKSKDFVFTAYPAR